MPQAQMTRLELEMTRAMKDLLGSGYITDYYRSAAADFVQIATFYEALRNNAQI